MLNSKRLTVRAARYSIRAATFAVILGVLPAAACMRAPEPGPSKEEIWKQVYIARLEALRALDQAFNALGQEYFKLEIEYRNSGRDDLAAISRERGRAFHAQHMEFKKRIADLEEIDARLRRGESAIGIETRRPAGTSTPVTPAAAVEPAAAEATPMRTPTPSPDALPAGDEAIETPESQP
jgi:hypothetical protein